MFPKVAPNERPDMREFRPRIFYQGRSSKGKYGLRKAQVSWACQVVTVYNMRRRSGVDIPYPKEPTLDESNARKRRVLFDGTKAAYRKPLDMHLVREGWGNTPAPDGGDTRRCPVVRTRSTRPPSASL